MLFADKSVRATRIAVLYTRLALSAAYLSGIAPRFGWWGKNVGYGNFANFERYTAQVNSFMPASTIPFLAWAATAAELFLGVAVHEEARKQFSEKELADLTLAVVTINAWNRLAIAARTVPGTYEPKKHEVQQRA